MTQFCEALKVYGEFTENTAHQHASFLFEVAPEDEVTVCTADKFRTDAVPKIAVGLDLGVADAKYPGNREELSRPGKRLTTVYTCTCLFHVHWGLICCHMFALFTYLASHRTCPVTTIPVSLVAKHWLASTGKPVQFAAPAAGGSGGSTTAVIRTTNRSVADAHEAMDKDQLFGVGTWLLDLWVAKGPHARKDLFREYLNPMFAAFKRRYPNDGIPLHSTVGL